VTPAAFGAKRPYGRVDARPSTAILHVGRDVLNIFQHQAKKSIVYFLPIERERSVLPSAQYGYAAKQAVTIDPCDLEAARKMDAENAMQAR